jgi:DNA-binding NtrC family response regulator
LHGAAVRGLTLDELQDLYIEEALELHGGNKVHAAAALGIDRKTLYRRAERKALRCSSREPEKGEKQ